VLYDNNLLKINYLKALKYVCSTLTLIYCLSVIFSRDGMRYLPGNELSIKTTHYESRDLQMGYKVRLRFTFYGKFELSFISILRLKKKPKRLRPFLTLCYRY